MLLCLALSACAGTAQRGRTEIPDLPGAFTFSAGRTTHVDLFDHAGDLLAAHEFEAAESIYRRIITLEPDNDSGYIGLGSSLFFQNRYDEAFEAYTRASQLAPESAEAFVSLGSVASRTGDLDSALNSYAKALDLDERNADAHWGMALALISQDHPGGAIAHLERVIALAPASSLADQARAKLWQLESVGSS